MDFLKSEISVDFSKMAKGGEGSSRRLADDVIQPFMIESSGLHGRYVRIGRELDAILSRHDYPLPVAKLLGEFLALSVSLASALKYDGVFTLQTKGDGPVPLMVADVASNGAMRGFAQVKGELPDGADDAPIPKLLGAGYLAFTVDFSTSTERHQGIVSLDGRTLADVIDHYFEQSAQFAASARLACGRESGGAWRAGALIVQHLPPEGGAGGAVLEEDDWNRAVTLLKSAKDDELLDRDLKPAELLFRLYNQDGVRVFEPKAVEDRCRCSEEKMLNALTTISRAEVEEIATDGKVDMVCEFCNTHRSFSLELIFDETTD